MLHNEANGALTTMKAKGVARLLLVGLVIAGAAKGSQSVARCTNFTRIWRWNGEVEEFSAPIMCDQTHPHCYRFDVALTEGGQPSVMELGGCTGEDGCLVMEGLAAKSVNDDAYSVDERRASTIDFDDDTLTAILGPGFGPHVRATIRTAFLKAAPSRRLALAGETSNYRCTECWDKDFCNDDIAAGFVASPSLTVVVLSAGLALHLLGLGLAASSRGCSTQRQ